MDTLIELETDIDFVEYKLKKAKDPKVKAAYLRLVEILRAWEKGLL